MRIPFLKMQGIGNDFIVVDDVRDPQKTSRLDPGLARRMCDRRFGVGADQILWLRRPQAADADARMEILNADGSTAEMCGNGIRAVGIYLFRHGPQPGRATYRVETLAGMKLVTVQGDQVTVDMGAPVLGERARQGETIEVRVAGPEGETARVLQFHEISMGNPHAVFFLSSEADLRALDLERVGPAIENHPRFPKRTNVEFVAVTGPDSIQVRVWERGAGITLACGTGACASAVATLLTSRARGKVAVHLPGGALRVAWEGEGKPVMMEGSAAEVFRGEYLG